MRFFYSLALVAVSLVACGKQSPVAIVDGYQRAPSVYEEPYKKTSVNVAKRAFDIQSEAIIGFQQEEEYFVQDGDKLEQLSKHFGVSESAILARNKMASTEDMVSGISIVIPSPNWQALNVPPTAATRYRLTDKYAVVENKTEAPLLKIENVQAKKTINLMRQHTLQAGENIYRVALRYNVSQFDILAANNIRNPADLKAGMVLNIPQAGDIVSGRDSYRYLANKDLFVVPKSSVQKMKINEVSSVVKVGKAPVKINYYDALAQKYSQKVSIRKGMIWPAKGRLLKTFGQKGRGVSHSGINIALAKDTPIQAAESGTVIYADNGLELYGNLVLIQHKGGYVTAYAHNAKNMVKRHQKVKKGQLIAFAGNTGEVEKVQLHFEVRKNAQAINPLKILPKR